MVVRPRDLKRFREDIAGLEDSQGAAKLAKAISNYDADGLLERLQAIDRNELVDGKRVLHAHLKELTASKQANRRNWEERLEKVGHLLPTVLSAPALTTPPTVLSAPALTTPPTVLSAPALTTPPTVLSAPALTTPPAPPPPAPRPPPAPAPTTAAAPPAPAARASSPRSSATGRSAARPPKHQDLAHARRAVGEARRQEARGSASRDAGDAVCECLTAVEWNSYVDAILCGEAAPRTGNGSSSRGPMGAPPQLSRAPLVRAAGESDDGAAFRREIECHPATCPMGDKCQNRCFAAKLGSKVSVEKADQCGWGLFAGEPIAKRACDPSCRLEKWRCGSQDRYGIFALRSVKPGEQLTFDYRWASFERCYCARANCVGVMGGVKKNPVLVDRPSDAPTAFEVRSYLGHGATGTVFEVEIDGSGGGGRFALKVELGERSTLRFEARLALAVRARTSPAPRVGRVVEPTGLWLWSEAQAMSMRYGAALADVLRLAAARTTAVGSLLLPEPVALFLAVAVMEAVLAVHDADVLHLDVKLDNSAAVLGEGRDGRACVLRDVADVADTAAANGFGLVLIDFGRAPTLTARKKLVKRARRALDAKCPNGFASLRGPLLRHLRKDE
ncbi:SET domain-containing protein [Aureococcus anophagefferens]|nr:SET domain-containing protein [Aureococcus anophagefferens]